MRFGVLFLLTMLAAGLTAEAGDVVQFPSLDGANREVLGIDSATDIEAIAPLVAAFQARNPTVAVRYHDMLTGELYQASKEACRGARPAADLVFSSAIDLQIKLVNDGCAQPHRTGLVEALPDWARWRDELFGLTFEPAVIAYSTTGLAPGRVPQTRFDLIDLLRSETERFRGRVATYDIQQSGVGYLFAYEDARQASTFGRLIESFGRTDVVQLCCTGAILDGISEGRFLVGYNVLGSYAIARARSDPRVGVILPRDYTLVLSRAAYIPSNAPAPQLAKQFIDFALSEEGRAVLSQESLLFSPQGGAEALERIGVLSQGEQLLRPIVLSPALIVGLDRQKRASFIEQWRASVSRQVSKPD